ncbi:TIGR03759 family integrating conjugative element protein [Salmonella enterica subsp. enterica serovar Worthington]|uniref:TIGR03759 family integrating conjugative element protein n=1 Tax=Salmonella enterica subsp. enterica serovar Ank TaxID=1173578 RepID=A0A726YWN5_SALET|nr:TIGR03759 family integrating conjugative element protein [Salmonella enterica]EBS1325794.1 TIGR03759 family integrating conjugative element protein [Salmonella enterica subsp. enterica serovar Muenchen]EBV7252028.1 TIGR03759 family integrating conjugative element protein [Salmonella enterica subsp. enterica serovar Pomona]EDJ9087964.1 TIGR03759 family integrating conjugative element protein [Salmonella enterica subsp. enterica serovar Vitkin]EGI5053424.1 TIGR03759 family integrating conjugat
MKPVLRYFPLWMWAAPVMAVVMMSQPALASVSTGSSVSTPQQQGKSTVDRTQVSGSAWGLSDKEWQQYQQVIKGPRGTQSPGIDPLMALGIEAESDSERRRFAEMWVKTEHDRVEKELAFQREVDAAWKRLYPRVLPVNMGNASGIAHDTQGRLALFVKRNCVRCDARLNAILTDKRPVDIYLVDSGGRDDVIRQWAQAHNIPADRVRSRQITLNHDNGNWLKYGQGRMPVVLQQGEAGWQIAAF